MKKLNLIKLVLATAISFLLYNCESNSEDVLEVEPVADVEVASMCFSDMKKAEGGKARAVSYPSKHWVNGQTIRVKFLSGTTRFQAKVKEYASEWEKYANIKFQWVSSNSPADIKIYIGGSKHWSNLGTDSKYSQHSMNLGYYDNGGPIPRGFKRTVIHEFGHALGLDHEHKNPTAGIKWNKPQVYKDYAAWYKWTEAMVDFNVFEKLSKNSTNYSEYDPKSIMHYPIYASHTLDGYSVGTNNNISAIDKKFISEVYPRGASNTSGGNICKGVANYNGSTSYSVGDKVIFEGYVFKRTSNDWINLGACTN
ncbi:M12 family metallopeptidase [Tenacibaculum ovolyticum]|uniref:M12 family metallopeptidase n=1 Tax=Tenacibaculum ovolyticum TaxID=104270 RepID=UPI003BA8EE82